MPTGLSNAFLAVDFARQAEKAYAGRLPDGWARTSYGFSHALVSWYMDDSAEPDQRKALRALFDYLDRMDQAKSEG